MSSTHPLDRVGHGAAWHRHVTAAIAKKVALSARAVLAKGKTKKAEQAI
jgi:hypothetical protein